MTGVVGLDLWVSSALRTRSAKIGAGLRRRGTGSILVVSLFVVVGGVGGRPDPCLLRTGVVLSLSSWVASELADANEEASSNAPGTLKPGKSFLCRFKLLLGLASGPASEVGLFEPLIASRTVSMILRHWLCMYNMEVNRKD
jgi:hypothetical protein